MNFKRYNMFLRYLSLGYAPEIAARRAEASIADGDPVQHRLDIPKNVSLIVRYEWDDGSAVVYDHDGKYEVEPVTTPVITNEVKQHG